METLPWISLCTFSVVPGTMRFDLYTRAQCGRGRPKCNANNWQQARTAIRAWNTRKLWKDYHIMALANVKNDVIRQTINIGNQCHAPFAKQRKVTAASRQSPAIIERQNTIKRAPFTGCLAAHDDTRSHPGVMTARTAHLTRDQRFPWLFPQYTVEWPPPLSTAKGAQRRSLMTGSSG